MQIINKNQTKYEGKGGILFFFFLMVMHKESDTESVFFCVMSLTKKMAQRCCAVLCCAWLCLAVPGCAWLCCAVPCCAVLCPAVPGYTWMCCAVPMKTCVSRYIRSSLGSDNILCKQTKKSEFERKGENFIFFSYGMAQNKLRKCQHCIPCIGMMTSLFLGDC